MFILAILFNLFSSYFLASIFNSFLIIFIAFFALIVLNMEILSLFSAINELNAFIFSIINFIITFVIFKHKKIIPLKINFDFNRLKNCFKLDKGLIIPAVAFSILLFATLFFALVMPVLEPDSQTYHFLRAYEFVKQGSLNHFETNDIRALIMPINSEIVYSWLLLFKKNFHGYGIVSYCAFLFAICSMWSIFEKFKFAFQKRLFAIFIFSSLSAIIIQIPSMQTDLLVGSLLMGAFALFIKDKIYFSSLALALAFGVKSTGCMSVFGFYFAIILYQILIEKNKNLSKIGIFSIFLAINFLIFSSYNYFLNLIDFHNPFGNRASIIGHKFWGGFEGFIGNIIRFAFQGLDFTGFLWGYYLNDEILNAKNQIFNFLHINPFAGMNVDLDRVNIGTDEQTVGFGILGFLAFIPMLFISFFKFFFNKNKKTILLFIFTLAFLINICILASTVAYMVYSIRFIVSFVCFSSIILITVYQKRGVVKFLVTFFCVFYMLLIPFYNIRMPTIAIIQSLIKYKFNMNEFENACYERKVIFVFDIAAKLKQVIEEKYSDKKNIAYIKSIRTPALYLKKLEKKGYNIDFLNAGKLSYEKLKKYDLLILDDVTQEDNVFNPEDIEIRYEITKNQEIKFNDYDKLNCYYTMSSNSNNYEDALERICLTHPFVVKNKDFKLNYTQEQRAFGFDKDMKIFYFIKEK